ncbi:unnamed protein product, partial [Allacma fusca]
MSPSLDTQMRPAEVFPRYDHRTYPQREVATNQQREATNSSSTTASEESQQDDRRENVGVMNR